MKCVSLLQDWNGDGWTLYTGMDQITENELEEFATAEKAIDYVNMDTNAETLLVVENGERGGYTRKLERKGLLLEDVS